MADYDLSRPAPDRYNYETGSGAGGLGFILVGLVIVLVVLYAVFGGAGVPVEQSPDQVAPAAVEETTAPAAAEAVPAGDG